MIEAPWYDSPVEKTAFNCYAMDEDHKMSLDKVAREIVTVYEDTGGTNFTLDGRFSESDYEYLEHKINIELRKRGLR